MSPQPPLGRAAALAILAALLAIAPLSAQNILNRNLILNGDAESGPAAQNPTDPKVSSVPNWTTTGGFSVGVYAQSGFLSMDDYGPGSRGKQLFYGGPGAQRSTAVQTVDLSAAAVEIDAGTIKYAFTGYLGVLYGSYDNIHLTALKVEFQDAAGATLLTATAAGPTSADYNIPEGILVRSTSGWLPANVRKAKVTIDLYTGDSGFNGYAADNISLVIGTAPWLGVNLLANGNAEAPPEMSDGRPVPAWNADTYLAAWKYNDYGLPSKSDNGPSDRASNFFVCPSNHSQCRAYQTVDFSAYAKTVDAGGVTFTLSGWFGGDSNTPDNADATVTFYDASGKALGSAQRIGPITQANRGNQRGLWPATTTGAVPAGARSAQIDLFFHKLSPPQDNLGAYADSLVFQLDRIQITSVVNAASSQSGAVAPGEFVTLYGSSIGPANPAFAAGSEKGLGGVHVSFNGVEAFLTYAGSGQINALVPYGISGKADIALTYNGRNAAYPLPLAGAAPGIFTQQYGAGQAWAVNNDAAFNDAAHPVARGGWISFWATGQGLVTPAGQDGESLSAAKNVQQNVKLTIGGADAQVLWTGLIYTGEIQVNAMIPTGIPAGDNEIVLTIGAASSRKGVTVAIK